MATAHDDHEICAFCGHKQSTHTDTGCARQECGCLVFQEPREVSTPRPPRTPRPDPIRARDELWMRALTLTLPDTEADKVIAAFGRLRRTMGAV